jgi:rubredoxin
VCGHVYDPVKDGQGKAFEDLPDTWTCPVCGASKAAYKKQLAEDGEALWVHEHQGGFEQMQI